MSFSASNEIVNSSLTNRGYTFSLTAVYVQRFSFLQKIWNVITRVYIYGKERLYQMDFFPGERTYFLSSRGVITFYGVQPRKKIAYSPVISAFRFNKRIIYCKYSVFVLSSFQFRRRPANAAKNALVCTKRRFRWSMNGVAAATAFESTEGCAKM